MKKMMVLGLGLGLISMSIYAAIPIDVYFAFPNANQFQFSEQGIETGQLVDCTQYNNANNISGPSASVLTSQVNVVNNSNPAIIAISGPAIFVVNNEYCIPNVTTAQLGLALPQPGSGESIIYQATSAATFTVNATGPSWIRYNSGGTTGTYYLTSCQYDVQHGVALLLCDYQ